MFSLLGKYNEPETNLYSFGMARASRGRNPWAEPFFQVSTKQVSWVSQASGNPDMFSFFHICRGSPLPDAGETTENKVPGSSSETRTNNTVASWDSVRVRENCVKAVRYLI